MNSPLQLKLGCCSLFKLPTDLGTRCKEVVIFRVGVEIGEGFGADTLQLPSFNNKQLGHEAQIKKVEKKFVTCGYSCSLHNYHFIPAKCIHSFFIRINFIRITRLKIGEI